jgi:hypothetical protein
MASALLLPADGRSGLDSFRFEALAVGAPADMLAGATGTRQVPRPAYDLNDDPQDHPQQGDQRRTVFGTLTMIGCCSRACVRWIYGLGIAAVFVMITVYPYLGEPRL